MIEISREEHPLLQIRAFETAFPATVDAMPATPELTRLLSLDADTPFPPDERLRVAIRNMLRHGGYKPTGRGKPASEYLVRAATDGTLASINAAVDACNAVSLHGGFPISVVDLARAKPAFRIAIAPPGSRYAFNRSAQQIDVTGLVCLFDAEGPCANAVKDAQRTKTDGSTVRTLSIIWGSAGWEHHLDSVNEWYQSLLASIGAETVPLD